MIRLKTGGTLGKLSISCSVADTQMVCVIPPELLYVMIFKAVKTM